MYEFGDGVEVDGMAEVQVQVQVMTRVQVRVQM